MHDLVIKGGTVVDGTGAAARTADVAITDGVVTEVGRVDGAAREEIDADGLLVTPGLRRRAHALRRADHLGPAAHARRAGTGSRRSSWATAASGSPRCNPSGATG